MSDISISFLASVQKKAVTAPTSRDFSLSSWEYAYDQSMKADGDEAVYRAGQIIGENLKRLWIQVGESGLGGHPRSEAMRYVTTCANRAFLQARTLLANAVNGQDQLPMASTGHLRLPYAANDTATYDGLITGSIDVWSRLLKYVVSESTIETSRAGFLETAVHDAFPLFSAIDMLEYFWGRVLFQNWRLVQTGDDISVHPPERDLMSASYSVSESRRDLEDGEFAIVFDEAWSAGAELPPSLKVQVSRIAPEVNFEFEVRRPGKSVMPSTLPSRQRLETSELSLVLDDPLRKDGEPFSLRDLLDAWEILSSASNSIADRLLKEKLDPSALTIHYSKIEKLLDVLDWTGAKRRAVIEFLTYHPKSVDGLWSNPFVLLDDGSLLPTLACLVEPNLYRLCEQWLSSAKANDVLRLRGDRFEKQMRERCKTEITASILGDEIFVVVDNWKPKVGDIDLAFRIGDTIFIAELKFRKFPTLPVEISRYHDELQHAADQLGKRLAFLERNRKAAAQKTGYRGRPEQLQMFGFILTAAQFGAGLKIGDFPVVDSNLFFEFFRLDYFFAMIEHQSLLDPKASKTLFKIPLRTGRGLSADLIRHIGSPLRIRWFEFAITEHQRAMILKTSPEMRFAWTELSVDAGALIGDVGVRNFQKLLKCDKEARENG